MKLIHSKRNTQGFTLIELLVVIGIIGVLAGIVMVSLSNARGKGSVAGVRNSLAQLRTESNLYINDNGNFGTAVAANCSSANTVFANAKFTSIRQAAETTAGYSAVCVNSITGLGAWALSIQTRPDGTGNTFLCTDSTGKIKAYASAPSIAGAVCP